MSALRQSKALARSRMSPAPDSRASALPTTQASSWQKTKPTSGGMRNRRRSRPPSGVTTAVEDMKSIVGASSRTGWNPGHFSSLPVRNLKMPKMIPAQTLATGPTHRQGPLNLQKASWLPRNRSSHHLQSGRNAIAAGNMRRA